MRRYSINDASLKQHLSLLNSVLARAGERFLGPNGNEICQKTASHGRNQRQGSETFQDSDLLKYSDAPLINGVFILTRAAFELTAPVL